MKNLKCFLAIVIMLLSSVAMAATLEVGPGKPYTSIQDAIIAADPATDDVLVYPGTYPENIDFIGKDIVVRSKDGPDVTIIDGGGSGSVVTFTGFETQDAKLIGFTITNGQGIAGGGIYCHNSSPTLMNNIITNNSAFWNGGGISLWLSDAIIKNTVISNNISNVSGNNTDHGGGIAISSFGGQSTPILVNVVISGNIAHTPGCQLTGWGGGIYCTDDVNLAMINVTIADNASEGNRGGGVFCQENCNINIENCILWNDSPEEIYIRTLEDPSTVNIRYSDVQGGPGGIVGGTANWLTGNIVSDPVFIGSGDYHLLKDSPCIDAGDNDAVLVGVTTDLDGKSRFFDCPFKSDSGNPGVVGPPVVDMGAYEVQCFISVYKDDIKWSQPPVEDNRGRINGWDEVSVLDANCWDCPTQCHGDADCNGYVDQTDLNILTAAYGTSSGEPNYNPCADFDRDGDVDSSDHSILLSAWHTYPLTDCPSAGVIVADDWLCLDDRPIKDIHWWGSFKGWTERIPPENEMPSAFHIGIWTDVPDPEPNNPNTFSHPGELVWENICDCYVWSYAGCDVDPRGEGENDTCFKFDQLLSQDKWFYQESNEPNGTVYWLSIAAIYDGNTPEHPWGWKTRPHFYNDDAVRIMDVNEGLWPPVIGSFWENGEPIEYPEGTSWDMAFVLTTNRKYTPRRWHWPPDPIPPLPDPPLPTPEIYPVAVVDIYEDGEINFKDFAVIASYWLEEATFWP